MRVARSLMNLVAICTIAGQSYAAPILDLSRTSIPAVLSDVANLGSPQYNDQLVRLTNVGTEPLVIDSVALVEQVAFALMGNCHGVLMPDEGCSVIVRYTTISAFYSSTQVVISSNATGSPHAVAVSGASRAIGQQRSFPLATPPYVDFAKVELGSPGAASRITITNTGTGPASALGAVNVSGKNPLDFAVSGTRQTGTVLATGASCAFDVTFVPKSAGPRSAEITFTDSGLGAAFQVSLALVGYGLGASAAQAVEYYHAVLDHYFVTHVASEIAILDAGVQIKGWTRTGQSIPVGAAASGTTSPVCRMYIPPGLGDSHFYGRGSAECATTAQKNPSFVNEDPQFFHMTLPSAGTCPPGTVAIYRVFSNRPDANHRYMKDKALRDAMVAQHWLAEGDGPDLVVMCAPA